MGIRGFICFVIEGREKTAYNHFGSYPDGLGIDVLRWLRQADIDVIREQARNLRVVSDDEKPTENDIIRLAEFADTGVDNGDLSNWYVLLRDTQGDPGKILQAGVIEDASEFPLDSLFAEWGYVIDFDAGVFEVYRGFRTSPANGRFADRNQRGHSGDYYPVSLAASWPLDLDLLPTDPDFIAALGAGQ